MSKAVLLALALALPASLATAEEPPPGCGELHGRLAVIHYKPLTLYECTLSPDIATTIIASGAEKVGPVGAADPEAMTISKMKEPAGNIVVIQPKSEEVNRTPNLTFETKMEDGTVRPYYFLFHVAQHWGVPAIQLVYDGEPTPGSKTVPAGQMVPVAVQRQQALVASTMKTAPFYGGTNWDYSCMCDAGHELRPDISDNGQDTIISYPGSTPAAIVVARLDRDGTEKPGDLPHRESPVNFTPLAIGGPLLISEVAEYWTIRSGSLVVALRNDNYHPERVDQRTGSQSPSVVRVVHPTLPPKAVPAPRTAAASTPHGMANVQ